MKTQKPLFGLLAFAVLCACQANRPQTQTQHPGLQRDGSPGVQGLNSPTPSERPLSEPALETRLRGLTWETNGAHDLLFAIEVDGKSNPVIVLMRKDFIRKIVEIPISDEPLQSRVKNLLAGKIRLGGEIISPEQGVSQQSSQNSNSSLGDPRDRLEVILMNNDAWVIRAPIVQTAGAENLFQEIRAYIEKKLNPSAELEQKPLETDCNESSCSDSSGSSSSSATHSQEAASTQSSGEGCKNLTSLEGTWTSTIKLGETSYTNCAEITLSPTTSAPSSSPLKFQGTEIQETQRKGATAQISQFKSFYEYDAKSCMIKKMITDSGPSPEKPIFYKVTKAEKKDSITKIVYVICADEKCSDATNSRPLEAELREPAQSLLTAETAQK